MNQWQEMSNLGDVTYEKSFKLGDPLGEREHFLEIYKIRVDEIILP